MKICMDRTLAVTEDGKDLDATTAKIGKGAAGRSASRKLGWNATVRRSLDETNLAFIVGEQQWIVVFPLSCYNTRHHVGPNKSTIGFATLDSSNNSDETLQQSREHDESMVEKDIARSCTQAVAVE